MRKSISGVERRSMTTRSASRARLDAPMRSPRSSASAAPRVASHHAHDGDSGWPPSCATSLAACIVRSIEKLVPPPRSVASATCTGRRAIACAMQSRTARCRGNCSTSDSARSPSAIRAGNVKVRVVEVDAVCVHRAPAEQPELRVDVEIARVRRIKRADPLDLGDVFRDVRLQVRTGCLAPQCAGRLELRRRRRRGEPRRDRVGQPAAPVPAPDQRLALVVAALSPCRAAPRGALRSISTLPAIIRIAAPCALLEQRVDRRGVHGTEHGGRRDAVAQVLVEIARGDLARMPTSAKRASAGNVYAVSQSSSGLPPAPITGSCG